MYRGVHREKNEDEDSEDEADMLEKGAEDEIGMQLKYYEKYRRGMRGRWSGGGGCGGRGR